MSDKTQSALLAFISKWGTGLSNQSKFRADLSDLLKVHASEAHSAAVMASDGPKTKLVYKIVLKSKLEITEEHRTAISSALTTIQDELGVALENPTCVKDLFSVIVHSKPDQAPKSLVKGIKMISNKLLKPGVSHNQFWKPEYLVISLSTDDMKDLMDAFTS